MQMADHRQSVGAALTQDALENMRQDRSRHGGQQDMVSGFFLTRSSARVDPPQRGSAAQDVLICAPCQNLGDTLGSPAGVPRDSMSNLYVRRCRPVCYRHGSRTWLSDKGSNCKLELRTDSSFGWAWNIYCV